MTPTTTPRKQSTSSLFKTLNFELFLYCQKYFSAEYVKGMFTFERDMENLRLLCTFSYLSELLLYHTSTQAVDAHFETVLATN